MPIDVNVVKDALDDFEKENFVDAKEKIVGQIKTAKNDFLKGKLGLTGDFNLPIKTIETEIDQSDHKEDVENTENKEDVEEPLKRKGRRSLKRK